MAALAGFSRRRSSNVRAGGATGQRVPLDAKHDSLVGAWSAVACDDRSASLNGYLGKGSVSSATMWRDRRFPQGKSTRARWGVDGSEAGA